MRDFKKNSYYILTGEEREEKQKQCSHLFAFLYSINYYKLTESDFLILLEKIRKKEKQETKSKKIHKNLQKVKLPKTLDFMDILKLPASALHTTTYIYTITHAKYNSNYYTLINMKKNKTKMFIQQLYI